MCSWSIANDQISLSRFIGSGNPAKKCQSSNQAKKWKSLHEYSLSAIGVYLHLSEGEEKKTLFLLKSKNPIFFLVNIFPPNGTAPIPFNFPHILLAFISFIEVLIILFSYQNERNLDLMVFLQLESCRGLNCFFFSFENFKNYSQKLSDVRNKAKLENRFFNLNF